MDEKVICYDRNNGCNDWALMANQWQNNPFAYMIIMGMMRWMYGNDWQNQYANNPEIQSRFNQLSNQMSDNHNTDIINEAVKGNSARLGELASNLNVDLRAIQSGICDVRSGIQGLSGDVRAGFQGVQGDIRFTGERVINANLMGVKDMQSAFDHCCCENKLLTTQQGYENRLAIKDQTYQINDRLTGIANGLQKGFSDIGYILAQNKGEILSRQDAVGQRIVDTLKDHWNWEQSQALQDQKFENSQLRQNIYMRDLIEKGDGCGCGLNR
ncbi:MAG: hypothetical protein MJZ30_07500 [Paludibacteraceae bacterium]|nr:hypothetical protein [Paludibacteraceae bacterium]